MANTPNPVGLAYQEALDFGKHPLWPDFQVYALDQGIDTKGFVENWYKTWICFIAGARAERNRNIDDGK